LALIFLSYSSGISLPGQLVKSFESSKDVNPNVDDEDSKWVFVGPPSKYTYVDFPNQQHIAPIREQYESLVPLEAHIMSKCSDAKVMTQFGFFVRSLDLRPCGAEMAGGGAKRHG
jgi:hypothetical protein